MLQFKKIAADKKTEGKGKKKKVIESKDGGGDDKINEQEFVQYFSKIMKVETSHATALFRAADYTHYAHRMHVRPVRNQTTGGYELAFTEVLACLAKDAYFDEDEEDEDEDYFASEYMGTVQAAWRKHQNRARRRRLRRARHVGVPDERVLLRQPRLPTAPRARQPRQRPRLRLLRRKR